MKYSESCRKLLENLWFKSVALTSNYGVVFRIPTWKRDMISKTNYLLFQCFCSFSVFHFLERIFTWEESFYFRSKLDLQFCGKITDTYENGQESRGVGSCTSVGKVNKTIQPAIPPHFVEVYFLFLLRVKILELSGHRKLGKERKEWCNSSVS